MFNVLLYILFIYIILFFKHLYSMLYEKKLYYDFLVSRIVYMLKDIV